MHGVGGQHDEVGAAAFQGQGFAVQNLAGTVPVACGLGGFDDGKVQRADQQFGGVQPAQPLAYEAAEFAVVGLGGGGRHAAEDADGFHGGSLSRCFMVQPAGILEGRMLRL